MGEQPIFVLPLGMLGALKIRFDIPDNDQSPPRTRRVVPMGVEWRTTPWDPVPGWWLRCLDLDANGGEQLYPMEKMTNPRHGDTDAAPAEPQA